VTSEITTARQAVARLIATYFVLHLEAEAAKPEEVLLEDYPDVPVRAITRTWIDRVRREFAIGEDEKLPAENIFQTWCRLNEKFDYEDSSVFGYNRIFLPRVFDLRDGTPESQEQFYHDTREAFDGFDYERQGYTVSFFLNSESNMRELMRGVVRRHLPQWMNISKAS
jgi:hypothetical protein